MRASGRPRRSPAGPSSRHRAERPEDGARGEVLLVDRGRPAEPALADLDQRPARAPGSPDRPGPSSDASVSIRASAASMSPANERLDHRRGLRRQGAPPGPARALDRQAAGLEVGDQLADRPARPRQLGDPPEHSDLLGRVSTLVRPRPMRPGIAVAPLPDPQRMAAHAGELRHRRDRVLGHLAGLDHLAPHGGVDLTRRSRSNAGKRRARPQGGTSAKSRPVGSSDRSIPGSPEARAGGAERSQSPAPTEPEPPSFRRSRGGIPLRPLRGPPRRRPGRLGAAERGKPEPVPPAGHCAERSQFPPAPSEANSPAPSEANPPAPNEANRLRRADPGARLRSRGWGRAQRAPGVRRHGLPAGGSLRSTPAIRAPPWRLASTSLTGLSRSTPLSSRIDADPFSESAARAAPRIKRTCPAPQIDRPGSAASGDCPVENLQGARLRLSGVSVSRATGSRSGPSRAIDRKWPASPARRRPETPSGASPSALRQRAVRTGQRRRDFAHRARRFSAAEFSSPPPCLMFRKLT